MEKRLTVDLVYVGAMRSKGLVVHAYCPLDDAGQLADRAWMWATPLTDHPPGSQLRFDCAGADRRSIVKESSSYVRAWPDKDIVLSWDAAHISVMASARAMEADPPIGMVEALGPYRAAYAQLSHEERAVLIVQVVQCIVGQR